MKVYKDSLPNMSSSWLWLLLGGGHTQSIGPFGFARDGVWKRRCSTLKQKTSSPQDVIFEAFFRTKTNPSTFYRTNIVLLIWMFPPPQKKKEGLKKKKLGFHFPQRIQILQSPEDIDEVQRQLNEGWVDVECWGLWIHLTTGMSQEVSKWLVNWLMTYL